ncbi:MAG: AI-2E family transporter [Candidatus Promineifilaceae bacterium]|jgi:predicted PurR-regulated permease PerM
MSSKIEEPGTAEEVPAAPLYSANEAVYSPLWGPSTKLVIVVFGLILFAIAAWRFQGLIILVTVAAVIAYILNPLVVAVNERTRISRGWVILAIYLALAAALVAFFVSLGVAAYDQGTDFINQVPQLIDQIFSLFESLNEQSQAIVLFDRFSIEPINLPWESITNQLLGLIQPTISTSGGFVGQLAQSTLRSVGNFLFVFVISIYLIFEAPNVRSYLQDLATQPGYQSDVERMAQEFSRIWSAYLRGQVILGVVIFLVVWLGLTLLGVRNALALGFLAGLLEFVPTIGPIVSTLIAISVAFFQPTNPWGLAGWQFGLMVLIFMILVQQVENNALVPRIVGNALDLHPLIVIIGVFMGASLAGVLGAILAAPLLATLKLLAIYTWRKLFDMPPFPTPDPVLDPLTEPLETAVVSDTAPQSQPPAASTELE